LTVAGSARITNATLPFQFVNWTTTSSLGGIQFTENGNGTLDNGLVGNFLALGSTFSDITRRRNLSFQGYNGLEFWTYQNTGSSLRAMNIFSNGYVSIGQNTVSTARLLVQGTTTDSTAFGLFVTDNSSVVKFAVRNDGNVGIGTNAPTNILSIGGNSARTFWMERHTTANTAGNTLTVQAGGATTGATDKAGGNLILAPGLSTGTGNNQIIFQTSTPGTTGTADNALATRVTLDSTAMAMEVPVRLKSYTVATLPTGVTGNTAYVTDGDAGLAWGATVINSGAGATPYMVWFNGANWTVTGK
jgi:hypothetical protein